MANWQLKTPILFLIFNRLDTTSRVFEVIRQAKPSRLYIAADGPRSNKPGEAGRVAATRRVVLDNIDWPCEVHTLFRETNLGCRQAVSGAIDWFFENEEQGIILEDDCLPHPTFFRFCEELLAGYREDERIMAISGDNFQSGRKRTEDSYYFSRYSHIWGWASWRRAWQHYDVSMKLWPTLRGQGWLNDILLHPQLVKYWDKVFQSTYNNVVDTWDYQWLFACWTQSGLIILPNVNLVSNIGFHMEAAHTTTVNNPAASMAVGEMEFPLRHPPFMIRDVQADDFTQTHHYGTRTFLSRALRKVKHTFRAN